MCYLKQIVDFNAVNMCYRPYYLCKFMYVGMEVISDQNHLIYICCIMCVLLSSYAYLLYYVCTAVFTLDA